MVALNFTRAFEPEALSGPVSESSDDADELADPRPELPDPEPVSAPATAVPANTAVPTPKAKAKPPTRPTRRA